MNEEDRSHGTPINAVRNLDPTILQEDWERFLADAAPQTSLQ
jgi:hypothetical protein